MKNYSIIVNHSLTGHGCSRNCDYCNWKGSPLLPHGIQDYDLIREFVNECEKDFITISGGGDPLWNMKENRSKLLGLINLIKNLGKKVRIITREIHNICMFPEVDYWSISLDDIVMKKIHLVSGMHNVEFSMVLPPVHTDEVIKLKDYYVRLFGKLGKTLVLRENLNSLFPLDFKKLSFNNGLIKFLPKQGCFEGIYLTDKKIVGYDLIPDREKEMKGIISLNQIFMFGGVIKHFLTKGSIPYSDIDLIINSTTDLESIKRHFDIDSIKTLGKVQYIKMHHELDKTFELHILYDPTLSSADIILGILKAQLDIDRIFFWRNDYHYDHEYITEISDKILAKKATNFGTKSNNKFFNNELIFQNYKSKMIKKGFKIEENEC